MKRKMLAVDQVARTLGIPHQVAVELLHQPNGIPFVQTGQGVFVPADWLLAWIDQEIVRKKEGFTKWQRTTV